MIHTLSWRLATFALGGALVLGGLPPGSVASTAAADINSSTPAAVSAAWAPVPPPDKPLTKKEMNKVLRSLAAMPPAERALRTRIVRTANKEIGVHQTEPQCTTYGGTCEQAWCGAFARWVWREAGTIKAPRFAAPAGKPYYSAWWATYWGKWGNSHDRWKKRPTGGVGTPKPGDAIVYGKFRLHDKTFGNGHVGLVLYVHKDGTLTTVDGNIGDMVSRQRIDPRTATNGVGQLPVYGYVSPVPVP